MRLCEVCVWLEMREWIGQESSTDFHSAKTLFILAVGSIAVLECNINPEHLPVLGGQGAVWPCIWHFCAYDFSEALVESRKLMCGVAI